MQSLSFFWEDIWFGNAPLATQFWDLYCIVNERNKIIAEVWDGLVLKVSFRRNSQWFELDVVARSISFSVQEDKMIRQYESNGVYSSKSLYAIVNFRRVQPVLIPAVSHIKVPLPPPDPRISVAFLSKQGYDM